MPLDDQPTFELLNRGETMGVFQLESGGMVETCRKYEIEKIDDIIDLIALYRPGAMQFIDQMIEVKKGRKKPIYEHPLLEQVCGDTYGVMIYQEQVQNAAKLLAGYTLGGADLLRRAMGKKDPKKMAKERAKFVEGAADTNGIEREARQPDLRQDRDVRRLRFQQVALRLLRPHLLLDRLAEGEPPGRVHGRAALQRDPQHRQDRRLRLRVPPHGHRDPAAGPQRARSCASRRKSDPTAGKGIRYGLAAIKNCGEGAMAAADRRARGQRPLRLARRLLHPARLEGRQQAHPRKPRQGRRARLDRRDPRRRCSAASRQVVASASSAQRDRASGQVSLFDTMDFAAAAPAAEHRRPKPTSRNGRKDERLAHEKELLGFYVTGHPLDKFRGVIDSDRYKRLGLLDELDISNPRERFPFAGMIRSIEAQGHQDRQAVRRARASRTSPAAPRSCCGAKPSSPPATPGCSNPARSSSSSAPSRSTTAPAAAASPATTSTNSRPSAAATNGKGPLELMLWTTRHCERDLEEIRAALLAHPGKTPVLLHFQNSAGRRITIEAGPDFNVRRSLDLEQALGRWLD